MQTFCEGDSPHAQVCSAWRHLTNQVDECVGIQEACPAVALLPDWLVPCILSAIPPDGERPDGPTFLSCGPKMPEEGVDHDCDILANAPYYDAGFELVEGDGVLSCTDHSGVIVSAFLDVTLRCCPNGPWWNHKGFDQETAGSGSFEIEVTAAANCKRPSEESSAWNVVASGIVEFEVGRRRGLSGHRPQRRILLPGPVGWKRWHRPTIDRSAAATTTGHTGKSGSLGRHGQKPDLRSGVGIQLRASEQS